MKLLAPRDAAKILGVTTSRVQQLDRERRLRAVRDSAGRRYFREADVREFHRRRSPRCRNAEASRAKRDNPTRLDAEDVPALTPP